MKKVLFILSFLFSIAQGQILIPYKDVTVPISCGTDADAIAFLSATGISDATICEAIDSLVIDIKAINSAAVWAKLYFLHPHVGSDATSHKYNLKDPRDLDAAYRLTFGGGWTHTSTGSKPNGSTGYGDTHLVPNTVFNTTDLCAIGYYSRTNSAIAGEYVMATDDGTSGVIGLIARRDNDFRYTALDFASGTSYRNAFDFNSTSGIGLFIGNQTGSDIKLWVDGNVVASNTTSTLSLGLSTASLWIGGFNHSGVLGSPTDKECALDFASKSLTDAQVIALSAAILKFISKMGR
jgi:hypothetical protein